jgi:hypothetical protein
MGLTGVSVALLLVALAGWSIAGALERRTRLRWLIVPGRIALVLAALLAHLNMFEFMPATHALVGHVPRTHYHDVIHYYLGTRYFAEVGYTDLYPALVLADFEDAPSTFEPRAPVRDQRTDLITTRASTLEAARFVRPAFSDERWQTFKRDAAIFRNAMTASDWRDVMGDHGYNGTPAVTALLGALANQPWIASETFIRGVAVLDPLLIALFAALCALHGGWELALVFLFFTFANPLNDYSFIGGSYLRYAYYVALAAGLLALINARQRACGTWLSIAGWLRIFPLAIYGFLLLRDLAGGDRRQRLRANALLHTSFAAVTFAILVATSLVTTPDGRNPWLLFADKITAHASSAGLNQLYLAVPICSLPLVASTFADNSALAGDWELEKRCRHDHPWWIGAAAIPLLGIALTALRHATPIQAVLPALLATFVLPMSAYDWLILSLLPFVLRPGSRAEWGLLLLFATLAVTAYRDLAIRLDARFAVMSVEVLAYLALASIARSRGMAANWRSVAK